MKLPGGLLRRFPPVPSNQSAKPVLLPASASVLGANPLSLPARDVERALNFVEEMERAEEQFVKEMEVTTSQVMTVVGVWRRDGGRRGFDGGDVERFECFDMSWPVSVMEVRGVGEVRGKGEMVEEGVGEREGAFILMLDVQARSLMWDC